MKAINVVGHRGSGKTELVSRLARSLASRGRKVAIVKHCHAPIRVSPRDERFRLSGADYVLVSDGETVLFRRGRNPLSRVMRELRADFVVVEGFKSLATMPRIVCGRTPGERRALKRGLALAELDASRGLTGARIARLAALAGKSAFHLAGLDCGDCGRRNCRALALAIVAGRARPGDCRHADPAMTIAVDGESVPLNRFASRLMRNAIAGMVDSLKGVRKRGRVEIALRR